MPKGRKSSKKQYFGPEQEEAVVEFLSLGELIEDENSINGYIWVGSEEDELKRNRIYVKHLKHAFDKMIESIIRRYNLYSNEMSFEDLHSDTLSFLMVKFHKFKPSKGKKSYSYYGTVCKHYLLGKLMKADKRMKTLIPYEDISSSIEEREDLVYYIDKEDQDLTKFISEICDSIRCELEEEILTENETKVGNALVSILDNWEELFSGDGGNKYNKNLILLYMREITGMTTKDIRNAMKRYKSIYYIMKDASL